MRPRAHACGASARAGVQAQPAMRMAGDERLRQQRVLARLAPPAHIQHALHVAAVHIAAEVPHRAGAQAQPRRRDREIRNAAALPGLLPRGVGGEPLQQRRPRCGVLGRQLLDGDDDVDAEVAAGAAGERGSERGLARVCGEGRAMAPWRGNRMQRGAARVRQPSSTARRVLPRQPAAAAPPYADLQPHLSPMTSRLLPLLPARAIVVQRGRRRPPDRGAAPLGCCAWWTAPPQRGVRHGSILLCRFPGSGSGRRRCCLTKRLGGWSGSVQRGTCKV